MKTRLSIFLLFAFFSLNMGPVPLAGPSEFVGHWDGMADGQIAFTIDITVDGHELTAVLNAPDQGFTDLQSNLAELDGEHELKISFTIQNDQELIIEGALEDDGTFAGIYNMGEQAGVLTMTKKKEEK